MRFIIFEAHGVFQIRSLLKLLRQTDLHRFRRSCDRSDVSQTGVKTNHDSLQRRLRTLKRGQATFYVLPYGRCTWCARHAGLSPAATIEVTFASFDFTDVEFANFDFTEVEFRKR